MTLTNIAAFISTGLAICCTVPYIRAILNGKTKPHQLGWLVFVIMNGIVFFSQLLAGGRESVLISLIFFIGSFIVFLMSLRFGIKDTSPWDRWLFCFAIATVVIWFLTRSNDTAIWLTVVIDVAATAIMILKLKKEPHSEDPFPWIVSAVAYVFTCLTLAGRPLSILYVRPLYGLIGNVIFIGYIYYYRKKDSMRIETSPGEF
jgi:hypothetical protein